MERALPVVGTLRAQDDAIIAAQVAGQIETTRVDLGDRVTAGQELALIDTASYEALARQSAANLARVQAAAANAAQNLKRIQELRRDNIASTSELDLAVAESDQARAEVKSVEAADAVARLNLDRSRVRAPFDGVIAERILSAGAYAAIGTPIVRLVKADPLRLRLEVPEREAPAVRAGQTVRVTVEGDTNVYTGQLTRIAPDLQEANRMLTVEADVPAQGGLRPGLFVRAHIVVNASEPAVSVPESALTTFAGLEKIVTVKDGKAVERAVTTGRRGADWVEIVSGLAAGEPVVLDPAGLRMGQPVTTNLAEEEAQTAGEAGGAAR
jgi:RND family efflux transporter MFP subunit